MSGCRSAHLETSATVAELILRRPPAPPILNLRPAAHAQGNPSTPAPNTRHDRAKVRRIPAASGGWMSRLGINRDDGSISRGMESKFRQINRFVELMEPLLRQVLPENAPRPFHLVDLGCGKAYLTFALHQFLSRLGPIPLTVRGVDLRQDLVDANQRVASECGLAGMTFESTPIATLSLREVDAVVALHACDTATDDALAVAIQARVPLIVVSPCCHKELRPRLSPPDVLAPFLRHGIWRERHAEFATDALRVAILESQGYSVRVMEFVDPDDSRKNTLIAALLRPHGHPRAGAAAHLQAIADFYGIRNQHLADVLGLALSGTPAADPNRERNP